MLSRRRPRDRRSFPCAKPCPRFRSACGRLRSRQRRDAAAGSRASSISPTAKGQTRNSISSSPTSIERDAPRPIHMFVHGGYWRAQSKDRYAFIADEATAAGADGRYHRLFADAENANGDLGRSDAPRGALARRRMPRPSGATRRAISASGHSAGGHLASYLFARGRRRKGRRRRLFGGAPGQRPLRSRARSRGVFCRRRFGSPTRRSRRGLQLADGPPRTSR